MEVECESVNRLTNVTLDESDTLKIKIPVLDGSKREKQQLKWKTFPFPRLETGFCAENKLQVMTKATTNLLSGLSLTCHRNTKENSMKKKFPFSMNSS
ncbi:CLUMA_CG021600, isoform A [Clunio marinus]|uniref:CLUMA_CG021600, isoform A n=1 Tax=Clunio marinus TaxID=568069 RepID=A0A1J1J9Y0_9DIPT|nr:CLUMA_CG021600, isoform A [Clunio marinus]